MTPGNAAAARALFIIWCKACQHQTEPDPAERAAPQQSLASSGIIRLFRHRCCVSPLTNFRGSNAANLHDSITRRFFVLLALIAANAKDLLPMTAHAASLVRAREPFEAPPRCAPILKRSPY
jgi:hypothetical protein